MSGQAARSTASRVYRRLVGTTRQLVRAGVQDEPKWLKALERCPPVATETVRKPKPKTITFEEDRYLQPFYNRFPHAQQQPIDLQSDEPPPAKRFALRQLELVKSGIPPRRARDMVDDEFRELGLLDPPAGRNIGQSVQQLEEQQLRTAMAEKAR